MGEAIRLMGARHGNVEDPQGPHAGSAAQALQVRDRRARVARRLLAIANALSGISRTEAARSAGMDRHQRVYGLCMNLPGRKIRHIDLPGQRLLISLGGHATIERRDHWAGI